MTYAVHVTLAPAWFDPAETPGAITPFMVLYAFSDALVKPMPDGVLTPSLATSWEESADGLSYTFHLRQGVTFHNGDPFTAEDVKFSYKRYKGAGSSLYKKKVKAVEVVDAHTVRFVLNEPWPDFLTFYGTPATGAGWIVPKKYVKQVGDDGYKKHPIGAGPYRVVESKPGIEVIFEAYPRYWRKTPKVKTIIMKSIPEDATRLAMLKRGEADIAYQMDGLLGQELQRDPKLALVQSGGIGIFWLDFLEQYNPQSPWHHPKVRLAASYAIDRQALSAAETLGLAQPVGSIVPRSFPFYRHFEPHAYNPRKAKALLKEAGYPQGFDAGDLTPTPPYYSFAEGVAGYLAAVGITTQVRKMERAAYFAKLKQRELRGVCLCSSGAFGNAATRLENYVLTTGEYSSGGYKDIDALFEQQSQETDGNKRAALLYKIQELVHQRVMAVPIYAVVWSSGVGPRVKVSGLGLIDGFYYTGPFEDLELK
jgi:peptide/nickel transport system substrate-binding protein